MNDGAAATSALLRGLADVKPPTLQHLDLSDNPITEGSSAAYDTRALLALAQILSAPGCTLKTFDKVTVQISVDSSRPHRPKLDLAIVEPKLPKA